MKSPWLQPGTLRARLLLWGAPFCSLLLLVFGPYYPDDAWTGLVLGLVISAVTIIATAFLDAYKTEDFFRPLFYWTSSVLVVAIGVHWCFFVWFTVPVDGAETEIWKRIVYAPKYNAEGLKQLQAAETKGTDTSWFALIAKNRNHPEQVCDPSSLAWARAGAAAEWCFGYLCFSWWVSTVVICLRQRQERHEHREQTRRRASDKSQDKFAWLGNVKSSEEKAYRVSPSDRKPRFNVVFIHGIHGHWFDTWVSRDSSFYWPMAVAEDFPKAGVWSVHYNAYSIRWAGDTMRLRNRAENLIFLLDTERMFDLPTIFVAHSFGGLVVKKLLQVAHEREKHDRHVLDSVKAVIFLATPHQGSALATYLSKVFLARPSVTAGELKYGREELKELTDWYRNHKVESTFVYCEKLKVRLPLRIFRRVPLLRSIELASIIVNEQSSDPQLENVYVVPISATHITLCKPLNKEEPIYKGVKANIEKVVKGLERPQKT